jgi:hypothetical protein
MDIPSPNSRGDEDIPTTVKMEFFVSIPNYLDRTGQVSSGADSMTVTTTTAWGLSADNML